jgi:hypothetical protein
MALLSRLRALGPYYYAVLPIGGLFLIGGPLFVLIGWHSADWQLQVPPFVDPLEMQVAISILGVIIALIGYGLLRRHPAGYLGLLHYLVYGSILQWIVGDAELRLFGLVFNTLFGLWFGWTTRTVFFPKNEVPVLLESRIQ